MADNARKLVEDVLGPSMTREIWSLNYDKVLPISLYAVELPAVLFSSFLYVSFRTTQGTWQVLGYLWIEYWDTQ